MVWATLLSVASGLRSRLPSGSVSQPYHFAVFFVLPVRLSRYSRSNVVGSHEPIVAGRIKMLSDAMDIADKLSEEGLDCHRDTGLVLTSVRQLSRALREARRRGLPLVRVRLLNQRN